MKNINNLKQIKIRWQYVVLAAAIILSLFLNFWNLAKEGYSNEYYSAAVAGMLKNPAAFFFGSLDSGLYVTVDKPPIGLWIQALSVSIFGQNSFGFIFPSALAGALCVLLVFLIVKKIWGLTPGVLASCIMATTPILAAMSRTNNLDTLLLLFLLLASLVMLEAARRQSLSRYILAMALVGIAFNIKMLEAVFVVPAFVLVYLVMAKGAARKLVHTAIAVFVLAAASFSWAVVVDSIPSNERPYIGSSQNNSVMNLIFGYNGLSRLTGERGAGGLADGGTQNPDMGGGFQTPGGRNNAQNGQPGGGNAGRDGGYAQFGGESGQPGQSGGLPSGQNNGRQFMQGGNMQFGGGRMNGGPGGSQESGQPGLLRLYSSQLSGLISWFLLPALTAAALGIWGVFRWIFKKRNRDWTGGQKQKWLFILFWSAWLAPMALFFSYGGFIHRYYVVLMSPAIAILAACAAGVVWKSPRRKWLVPALAGAALAAQCVIAGGSVWNMLLIPMLACGGAGALLFVFAHRDSGRKRLQTFAAFLMAGALFIAPVAWSLTPAAQTLNATIPDAGPDTTGGFGRINESGREFSALEEYITAHYNGERWALAVSSANQAAPIMLDTGLPVMAVGGFSGADQILTLDKLKQYVEAGELKYYLTTGFGGNSEISQWLQQNGKEVSVGGYALYDLSEAAGQ